MTLDPLKKKQKQKQKQKQNKKSHRMRKASVIRLVCL